VKVSRYIFIVALVGGIALAAWFLANTTERKQPNLTQVFADVVDVLELGSEAREIVLLDRINILDGWSDGVELLATFSIKSRELIDVSRGPMQGRKFAGNKIHSGGTVELSYEFDKRNQWKLLRSKMTNPPIE
jgi:hypothetical protein